MVRNYTADSVKFLASFAVTLMHVSNYLPLTGRATFWNYYWYFPLLDLAVTLFFCMAGFFIASKELDYYPRYASRIFTINLSYSIFYLLFYWPLDIISQFDMGNNGWATLRHYMSTLSFTDFLTGIVGSEHLWFLMALFFAVVIFYLLRKASIPLSLIYSLSVILYAFTFTSQMKSLTDSLFLYGGFAKGLFYFLIGFWSAKNTKHTFNSNILIVVSLLMLIMGDTLTNSLVVREVLLAGATFSILTYVVNHPGKESLLSRSGKYSLSVYLLHILFIGGFNVAVSIFPVLATFPDVLRISVLTLVAMVGSVLLFPFTQKFFYYPIENLVNKRSIK